MQTIRDFSSGRNLQTFLLICDQGTKGKLSYFEMSVFTLLLVLKIYLYIIILQRISVHFSYLHGTEILFFYYFHNPNFGLSLCKYGFYLYIQEINVSFSIHSSIFHCIEVVYAHKSKLGLGFWIYDFFLYIQKLNVPIFPFNLVIFFILGVLSFFLWFSQT